MAIPTLNAYPMPSPSSFPANKVKWQINRTRAVLLIHDMQEYFVGFYGANNALVADLTRNIVALRAWANRCEIPVVYTAQPREQNAQDRALLNDMWGPGLTDKDPQLKNIIAPLTPDNNDTVLVKWRYSAFQRSPLQQLMRDWGRDQLIICGIYAHIGCLMTAGDAFMRDIQPFFVGDALADFSEDEHRYALRYVATRCGSVTDTQRVIAPRADINRDWLRTQLLAMIDEQEEFFDPDENLINYGLDSVQVMAMLAEWKKLGIQLTFEDLAREPTFNGWWALIVDRQRAAA